LKGQIQQFIDVYVSQATFGEVKRSFPYMVSRDFASGGGDVRENPVGLDTTSGSSPLIFSDSRI
jgi:hypothetical protein